MKQHDLTSPGSNRPRKRVGRGYGSGSGKTSGHGQKGQKSRGRGKIRIGLEGGQTPRIQRMPYKRGVGSPFKTHYELVNLSDLTDLDPATELNPESLLALGLVSRKKMSPDDFRVKLLGDGEITVPFRVRVHKVSSGARAKIEAAGGSVEEIS